MYGKGRDACLNSIHRLICKVECIELIVIRINMKHIHLNSIDLNLLLVFDCIYAEQSLTLAGQRLGRTQSAMSHALERLRGIFNDQLFIRTSNKMRPTSRAIELAEPIGKALQAINHVFVPATEFDPKNLNRIFRISMSDYCEMVVLPRLMEFLCQNAPGVRIEILSPATTDPQKGLEAGIFELVIGNKDVETGIYQQQLFDDLFVCMVSNANETVKDQINLKQYKEGFHIIFSTRGKNDRLLEECLKTHKINRKIALKVPNITVIPSVLEKTSYIVTLPLKTAKSLNMKSLKILTPPLKLPTLPIMQYWHEAVHKDPAHRWLRAVIMRQCY